MAKKPLHILVVVSVFLNARNTHCAKSSLLAPIPLLANVQTSIYVLKAILESLKHAKHQVVVMHVKCVIAN
jgi:hypothetical protein